MFVLGNFITAVAQVIDVVLNILYWLILIRVLISWVNPDPYNPIVVFLIRTTEPVIAPFRKLIPSNVGLDFSPILAFLAIMFIRAFLVRSLFQIAARMG